MKKNILIVEPGFKTYKEPIVRSMYSSGQFNLYFASGLSKTVSMDWTRPYSSGSFIFSYPRANLVKKSKLFMRDNKIKFDGALTLVETSVHFVNELQHQLGLPVISVRRDKTIRHKGAMRRLFQGTNVYQPKFEVIKNERQLKKFNGRNWSWHYHYIVKPAEMMSSLGVQKVSNKQEAMAAYRQAVNADFWNEDLRDQYGDMSKDVLLEGFVSGPEYSVESVVCGGEVYILGITKKTTTVGKYFDEVGHEYPVKMKRNLYKKIQAMVFDTHQCLKLKNTLTHTEFRLHDQKPYLMEVNCRLGGDLISTLIENSQNINLGMILANVHCGINIDDEIKTKGARASWGIYYFSTPLQGRVEAVPKGLNQKYAQEIECSLYVRPGDFVFTNGLMSVSRMGHVIYNKKKYAKKYLAEIKKGFEVNPFIFTRCLEHDDDYLGALIARRGDIKAIEEIERRSWPPAQRASGAKLRKRMDANESSFIVAYSLKTGKALGFIHYVPLKKFDPKDKLTWSHFDKISLNKKYHKAKFQPQCFYIVSISVLPTAPRGTGSGLLQAICSFAQHERVSIVAYGARASGYHKFKNRMSFDGYYRQLIVGEQKDHLLKAAYNAGGIPSGYIEDYFKDEKSGNYGILILHHTGHMKL